MHIIINVILNSFIFFGIIQLTATKDLNKGATYYNDRDPIENDKMRVCIVEGRGAYKKGEKFCPILESKSNIECVIALDRLDCLRRIHKGSAHFGVFSSEDLVAARWAGIEVLVINEMRFHNSPFEYEIVAVVDNEANINSVYDLSGSRFCHPGHGFQNGHWTDILANYFESTLVPRLCEADLSLIESRIKASAGYFGPTCKAGPWVPDPVQDRILKQRYPSLCELCDNPYQCGVGDKHWGRYGPLYCLTSGAGQVAWVRLDDVKSHFGFSGLPKQAEPEGFSYLCPDGHLQPISATQPCVWVAKPWPAVAAKRTSAEKISTYLERLSHNDPNSWENALLSLLETYHVNVTAMDMAIPIEDYLDQAVGFQSAYSFPSCTPPRGIVYCTTSLIAHAKCSWLQEASAVYGIEPNLQCIRTESLDRCMDNTKHKYADVVLVSPDERVRAESEFDLRPILFEYTPTLENRYTVVAVVKKSSQINSFEDLKGKVACFPSYEGASYTSVIETLRNLSLVNNDCPYSDEIQHFFSDQSCTWEQKSNKACDKSWKSDLGALQCLAARGDVAFINVDAYLAYKNGTYSNVHWGKVLLKEKTELLCPFGATNGRYFKSDICYMHWTSLGHLMIHNETSLMRRNEIYNSLKDMDRLFGKHYKSPVIPFTMFGPFDRKTDVMFHDATDGLKGLSELKRDKIIRHLELAYGNYTTKKCKPNRNAATGLNTHLISLSILVAFSSLVVRTVS